MEERTIDPSKFALIAGSLLLALPTFLWLGIFLEIYFKFPFIVKQIMLPIDRMSPLLSVMIMVGLPLISILINLKTLMEVDIKYRRKEVEFDLRINRNIAQWSMIIYAALSIVAILTYAFFENFKIVSAHFG